MVCSSVIKHPRKRKVKVLELDFKKSKNMLKGTHYLGAHQILIKYLWLTVIIRKSLARQILKKIGPRTDTSGTLCSSADQDLNDLLILLLC